MSRFFLALRCFFAVLFYGTLPKQAAAFLPAPPPKPLAPPALPAREVAPAVAPEPTPPAAPPSIEKLAPPSEESARPEKRAADSKEAVHRGAVQILALLQREGRLLDFLMEEIDSYQDAQIGAAVRDIHRGCRKALAEHMKTRPIRSEPDEAVVRIPEGYDPSQIRLVGRVAGRPPFEGTLRHHGWRTSDINLSDIPPGHDPSIICPAEVEIGA